MKLIPDALSPQQAWERLISVDTCNPRITEIAVADALNHCLLENFLAPNDVPIAERSFMDGYAVRSEDVTTVPVRLKIGGEVLMGEKPNFRLYGADAGIIPTGGFLPEGADAVVRQEDTEVGSDFVIIRQIVRSGDNIQRRAEDFRKGDPVCRAHVHLRPQDLSALAMFGVSRVTVQQMPRVAVISTGNELVPHDVEHVEAGKIRETNSLALVNAAKGFGFDAHSLGIVPDEFDAQRAALEDAMSYCEVILISGGSSVGARDFTSQVIQSFPHYKIHFHGLAIRPGNPTIFATIGSNMIFGVPGQPVSALIVFYLFILPFLCHLSGEKFQYDSFFPGHFVVANAKLAKTLQRLKEKTDYVRVRIQGGMALPVLGKSASLSTLALADGFIIVPPGEVAVEEGSRVQVFLFP